MRPTLGITLDILGTSSEVHHSLVWETIRRRIRDLQWDVWSAECSICNELSDLRSVYSKWCWTEARKILKDLSYPNNGLFSLLWSTVKQWGGASSHRLWTRTTPTTRAWNIPVYTTFLYTRIILCFIHLFIFSYRSVSAWHPNVEYIYNVCTFFL